MITFFNQFHNGDCFVGKGWASNIMVQLQNLHFRYAHNNPTEIIADLHVEQIPLGEIPALDPKTKVGRDAAGNLFVNTWCGAWQGELFDYSSHSNFKIQHQMYAQLCDIIGRQIGCQLYQSNKVENYLPSIDFTLLDLQRQRAFITEVKKHRKLILVCNGTARSGQSQLQDMSEVIAGLSQARPNDVILVTERLPVFGENIYYTSDINQRSCDLNEIAWLGTHADVIVGKNSGPFTWCQNIQTLMKPKKFIAFCVKASDVPMWDLNIPAQLVTSNTVDQTQALNFILEQL